MSSGRWLAFLIAILFFNAPTFGQGRLVPVTDPDTALQFNGFRIKPPSGKNWFIGGRDDRNVFFGKRVDSRTHSFVAAAFSRELEVASSNATEFFEFARKIKLTGMDPQRQTMVGQEFVEVNSPAPECLRYRIKVADRGAPNAKGESLMLEISGNICLHPNSRKHFVDVNYSERGGPQPSSMQLREEGEAFLRSLLFTQIN